MRHGGLSALVVHVGSSTVEGTFVSPPDFLHDIVAGCHVRWLLITHSFILLRKSVLGEFSNSVSLDTWVWIFLGCRGLLGVL